MLDISRCARHCTFYDSVKHLFSLFSPTRSHFSSWVPISSFSAYLPPPPPAFVPDTIPAQVYVCCVRKESRRVYCAWPVIWPIIWFHLLICLIHIYVHFPCPIFCIFFPHAMSCSHTCTLVFVTAVISVNPMPRRISVCLRALTLSPLLPFVLFECKFCDSHDFPLHSTCFWKKMDFVASFRRYLLISLLSFSSGQE